MTVRFVSFGLAKDQPSASTQETTGTKRLVADSGGGMVIPLRFPGRNPQGSPVTPINGLQLQETNISHQTGKRKNIVQKCLGRRDLSYQEGIVWCVEKKQSCFWTPDLSTVSRKKIDQTIFCG